MSTIVFAPLTEGPPDTQNVALPSAALRVSALGNEYADFGSAYFALSSAGEGFTESFAGGVGTVRLAAYGVSAPAPSTTVTGYGVAALPKLRSIGASGFSMVPNYGFADPADIFSLTATAASFEHFGAVAGPAGFALRAFGHDAAPLSTTVSGYGVAELRPLGSVGVQHFPVVTSLFTLMQSPGFLYAYGNAETYLAATSGVVASESAGLELYPWIFDSMRAYDNTGATLSAGVAILDALRADDMPTLAWLLLATDNIAITDATVANRSLLLAAVDLLLATDAVSTRLDAVAAVASALVLNDVAKWQLQLSAETDAEFSDTLSAAVAAALAAVDSLVAADSAQPFLMLSLLAEDTAKFGDSTQAVLDAVLAAASSNTVFASVRLGGETYDAWSLTTEGKAPSQYANFPFDYMASFKGRYFGGNLEGLFALGGDTDDGAPIDAWVRTGLSNLGTGRLKRMPAMYLGYTSDGAMMLKVVTTSETGYKREDWYSMTRARADAPREGRIKIGQGITSVYWGFELHNVAGADFAIDDIVLYPFMLTRRV